MPQTISSLSEASIERGRRHSRSANSYPGTVDRDFALANISGTCHHVWDTLSKLNDVGLSCREQFEARKLFRKPIEYSSDALKRHFVGTSFPLPLKTRGIVAQLYKLYGNGQGPPMHYG
jgi:hypothetical protein